ncbi:hypothetical protein [Haloarcula nitratireducens]|uniref:Uncharacterized protein n=1 Tax=Haloarcula nitratireducens TaxID=2487749 RepID=A0AAW4P8Z9_9EURY|nr:hypothetical protein [Halomicroarcula nitratireducens]MBX0294221.1 hypothetical protein [Halomicroarcula nitratireducens]
MPSETTDRTLEIGLATLSALILAYSLVIQGTILLGSLAVAVVWLVYLFHRFVLVLARIASALEQLAQRRVEDPTTAETTEAEATEATATAQPTDSHREPEREF